jgi:hypothetical protein
VWGGEGRDDPGILHVLFPDGPDGLWRRNKKLIEGKAKCRHKKIDL